MSASQFDRLIDLRTTPDGVRWNLHAPDVLPLWVADMDFAAPDAIGAAIAERASHPVFGYAVGDRRLRDTIVEWIAARHDWRIDPEHLVFLPGALPGIGMALKALTEPGQAVAMQLPIYGPIHAAPGFWGLHRIDVPLEAGPDGYGMGGLEDAIARSRVLMLCNPHNPSGKVYDRQELTRLADACERHDSFIVSDEVHCDLVHPGHCHVPIAALSPEVAARSITLMSAGKTFNISGLKLAYAIIPDPAIRQRFLASRHGMVPVTDSLMGLVGTQAALEHGEPWRRELVDYLAASRDHLQRELAQRIPAMKMIAPQASFLAWLDCRALGLGDNPAPFFMEHARLAFSPGPDFGPGGGGHLRFNFGCPRSRIDEAVSRMEHALASRSVPAGR